jgi:MinD-like ATPase involved in chromosome partitioning or flagellar assembly
VSDAPHVLIVTQDPELRTLSAALRAECIQAEIVSSFEEASRAAADDPRYVCVIDSSLPATLVVQVADLFSSGHASHPVILTRPDDSAWDPPANGAFSTSVTRCPRGDSLEETVRRLKATLILAGYDVRLSDPPFVPPPGPRVTMELGEVIAVFSVKGGVGKTTVAVNLAAGLAQQGVKPLLVDANLYFGDVPVLLDVSPRRSILDFCDVRELDLLTLNSVVTEHESGVSVLSSPPDFTTVETLNTETLVSAISLYRELYDYVVVDTRTSFDEATLQILDVADRILLVTTPEVGSVYQTARLLDVAGALDYRDRLLLILNRAGSGLEIKSVEQHLGSSVAASVVSAGHAVLSAANRGKPVLLADPDRKQRVARDLANLADLVRRPMPPRSSPMSRNSVGSKVDRLLKSVVG